jgi:hypothetical protein
MPSVIDSPSGRVPEKASRWDRGRTETCGGEKVTSGGSLLVFQYLRIYRSGIRSDGATRGPQGIRARPVALPSPRLPSGLLPKLTGSLMSRKKIVKKFRSVWSLFGTDFLENQKQAKKQQLSLSTRLIG